MHVNNDAKGISADTSTFIVKWESNKADVHHAAFEVGEFLSTFEGSVAVVARRATVDEEAEGAWAHDHLLAHILHEEADDEDDLGPGT